MFIVPKRIRSLAAGALVAIAAGAACAWWLAARSPGPGEPERWFIPGPLGHVPGMRAPSPSPRAFLTRAMSGVGPNGGGEWARHNGLTAPLEFMHNLNRVFPATLYASHPEYFPLAGGARLKPPAPPSPVNWNPDLGRPDVAAHAAAVAGRYFDEHPDAVSFALGVNDGLIFGESPETLALVTPPHWFRGRPDFSNLVFTFMNRAATDLARTHPDKYLGALAYYWAESPPDFPVNPLVVPFLTTDRSQGYDAAFKQDELTLQDRWAKSGVRRLGMYDYLDGFGFLIPRVHTRLIAENLRHAQRAGFTDYYGEASPNWGLEGPMSWLVAQLLQDPEQSEALLLDEYYRRYFREATMPMRRFFERCEEQWMRQPGPPYWLKYYRDESQAGVFPSAVCRELRGLLDEAARLAGAPEVKARVALVADAFDLTERFVDFCEARTSLVRNQLQGKLAGEAAVLEIQKYLRKRLRLTLYAAWLGRTQPLAVYSTKLDDFLRNDPLFGATIEVLCSTKPVAAAPQRKAEAGSLIGALAAIGDPQVQAAVRIFLQEETERTEGGNLKPETGNLRPEGGDLRPEVLRAAKPMAAAPRQSAEGFNSQPGTVNSEPGTMNLKPVAREIAINGSLEGKVRPGRRIGGLAYGFDLPAGWTSSCEPAQAQTVEFTAAAAHSGAVGLRVVGATDAALFQWVAAVPGTIYDATVFVRGRVAPGDSVVLTFGWLDASQRPVGGYKLARLPEGEWDGWVRLRQGGVAPAGTRWVGIGVRVQHQVAGDWVDLDDFSVSSCAGNCSAGL